MYLKMFKNLKNVLKDWNY